MSRLLVAALIGLVGCSGLAIPDHQATGPGLPGGPAITGPDAVVSLTIVPGELSLRVAEALTLRVEGHTRLGNTVAVEGVRWQSSTPVVATVDEVTGTVRVVSPGTARITATWHGLQGSANLYGAPFCRGPRLSATGPSSLRIGQQAQWTWHVVLCEGMTDSTVRFRSGDSAILHVTPEGLATARRAGSGLVIATLGQPAQVSVANSVTILP